MLNAHLHVNPPCLEYELVEGGNLINLMQKWKHPGGGMSYRQAAKIVQYLAETVGHFHRLPEPIVHRDLKPANVLVHRNSNGKYELKIADFGIGGLSAATANRKTSGSAESNAETRMSLLRGAYTPVYSSPQQRRGAGADPRDDVHALGVIWYQLLAGDVTKDRPSGRVWQRRLKTRGMPVTWIDLLIDCIEEEPADRPQDAAVLAERLKGLMEEGTASTATVPDDAETIQSKAVVPYTPPSPLSAPFDRAAAQAAQQAWASHSRHAIIDESKIGMEMVLIPPGEFEMGGDQSTEEVARIGNAIPKYYTSEHPQHHVRLTQPFMINRLQITQQQWQQVMGNNPSHFFQSVERDTRRFPVESVSWYDVVEFCNKLSELEGLSAFYALAEIKRNDDLISSANVTINGGGGYRLPTEAEWEYGCRAGTTTPFHFGGTSNGQESNINGKYPYAASTGSYLGRPATVASYGDYANNYGLFDMHGNVWEWCEDWYDEKFYEKSPTDDPVNTTEATFRVLRGGSWYVAAGDTRSANRSGYTPDYRNYLVGFRVARTL